MKLTFRGEQNTHQVVKEQDKGVGTLDCYLILKGQGRSLINDTEAET